MTTYSDEEVREAIKDLEKNCSGNVFYSPVTWAASQYLKQKHQQSQPDEPRDSGYYGDK